MHSYPAGEIAKLSIVAERGLPGRVPLKPPAPEQTEGEPMAPESMDVSIVLCGPAGQGVQTAEQLMVA
ncbi:MAG: hypothetical protein JW990_17570, partial [Thermoleophilia bacterium]|nr:hypothetical protein [Thermoleophilia bacterium]